MKASIPIVEYFISTNKQFTLCFNSESEYWHFNIDSEHIYIEQEIYWDELYDNVEFSETDKNSFSIDDWKEIKNIIYFIYYYIKNIGFKIDIDENKLFNDFNEFIIKEKIII